MNEEIKRHGGFPKAGGLLLSFSLIAFPATSSALDSGAAFLRIPVGARPSAMGNAFTAALDDLNSIYYNPAGLSTLKERQAGLMHANWLENTTFDFIGAAVPTRMGTVGLGMTRLATAIPDGYDQNRQATSGFQNSDSAYTLSYSRTLGMFGLKKTYLGMNLKLLDSQIASYEARTFAADLGAVHELQDLPLSVGASILNIGKGMSFISQTDALPLTVSAGAAWRVGGTLNLAADLARDVYGQRSDLRIGTEYSALPAVSLRMGYASTMAASFQRTGGLSALTGLGMGLGLRLGKWSVDYNFSPMAQLGDVQRISLGARF